jgi:hypothetical protein
MTKIIKKLQNKSDGEKTAIAMASSVLVTGMLFTVWGYNFAHSGKINNLASSAAGVAGAVEEAKLSENFNNVITQFKALGVVDDSVEKDDALPDTLNTLEQGGAGQAAAAAGAKHLNVFKTNATEQQYGDYPADVLY